MSGPQKIEAFGKVYMHLLVTALTVMGSITLFFVKGIYVDFQETKSKVATVERRMDVQEQKLTDLKELVNEQKFDK